jgi:hypothetical protein
MLRPSGGFVRSWKSVWATRVFCRSKDIQAAMGTRKREERRFLPEGMLEVP